MRLESRLTTLTFSSTWADGRWDWMAGGTGEKAENTTAQVCRRIIPLGSAPIGARSGSRVPKSSID
ncbi:hypothetical protein E2C01_020210 [Portunus trituberculatus]|uniref:Uncharacterized protein n=1 Tax=Portunus trituberculatus TaxID=210409 RepID=A0A5B7E1N9_PORTR|nr:hypothetical protein [Portunus trituberculatus]